MENATLPSACQFDTSDAPGKQLFAMYNRGGPPETRGVAWNGKPVPTWEGVTDQVRAKWSYLAKLTGFVGMPDTTDPKPEANDLPTLNHGHAWLLKFLFSNFRTEPFTFNVDKCSFEGAGKGIQAEAEADLIRRWFSECVEHGAIALHTEPDPGIPPVWFVRSLASTTDTVTTLDPNMTLDKLVREFVSILPADQVAHAACVVVKGAGIPDDFGDTLHTALVKHGAPANLLVIALPPGVDLSLLREKQMKANGWERVKKGPKIWTPGQR